MYYLPYCRIFQNRAKKFQNAETRFIFCTITFFNVSLSGKK